MKQLLIVVLCALPATAFAGPKDEAKKHIEKATEAHQAQKYDVALSELQAAYQLDPQPDLLYAIGQVQVKLNNCPDAIQSYQKFLDTKPAPEPAAAANEAIKTCQDELAKAQPPPPPPPQPQPPPPPPPPQPEGTPFYKDVVGDALVGVGVAASVGGFVMYMSARGKLDDADKATTYMDHQSLVDAAHSRRTVAVILGGVGVAALGVGVWRYTQVHKQERAVALVPTTSGGMVTWMGRF